nr:hypothetical protein [Streptomyces blattellae]
MGSAEHEVDPGEELATDAVGDVRDLFGAVVGGVDVDRYGRWPAGSVTMRAISSETMDASAFSGARAAGFFATCSLRPGYFVLAGSSRARTSVMASMAPLLAA